MAPRERVRICRQVTIGVPATESANKVQESNEISNNPYDPIKQNTEKSMFDRFGQRLVDHFMPTPFIVDKRFNIERLRALGATTFEETKNLADTKKWLNLIEKYFGVMEWPEERKVKLATFLLQGSVKD
ncbi:hypothetical protein E5676_scaffold775G00680 [Cucumis melo var. makuwa]|uniref:Uncharacterized protein n=1 Tax=Cucumis melo var. makuwa TaxID=1194695 RepID=A0A5D3BUF6_CUCMM|nr:hypothetical protein E6C27_scaffold744G00310 [Cucumis melo var. makuwa]TYK01739.1 hypothetical protein E5676_scaffold775G00680 [Cucumis melo var. makuwa]